MPLGEFWQCLEILLLGKLLASMNKGQDAAKHPIMHRIPLSSPLWHYPSPPPPPTTKNYVEQIAYSAEVGKLYFIWKKKWRALYFFNFFSLLTVKRTDYLLIYFNKVNLYKLWWQSLGQCISESILIWSERSCFQLSELRLGFYSQMCLQQIQKHLSQPLDPLCQK